ncbi:MAG: tetratricopeptide repeat protein [Pirellulales bacterium]|nr:tetratricopeptide repeat protein [Pirellulales bacterium]
MKAGRSRILFALLVVGLGLTGVGVLLAWFQSNQPAEQTAAQPIAVPPAAAELASHRADMTSVRDLQGNQRSLESLAGPNGTVFAFLGVECPLANLYVPRLLEIEQQYRARGIHFVAVYAHENEPLTESAAHALERDIPFTVVKDFGQRLADSLEVTRTPTVCLFDAQGGLQYRGRVSDQFGVNYRREKADREDLQLALDELLAGQAIAQATTHADGCLLDRRRDTPVATPSTYADVAPILAARCAACHRAGQSAPFALATYDDAVQWSKMIREVVLERRMPPWHADERYGHFANDRRLSQNEIDQLVAWIDGGLVPGDADVEAGKLASVPAWEIGSPEAVIQIAEPFQVPASGVLSYDYLSLSPDVTAQVFDRDRWIEAAQLKPSNAAVVHHMTLAVVPPGARSNPDDATPLPMLAAWAPGDPVFRYPPGTALRIPKDSTLMFEVHHVPNGTATQNQPSVAFSFSDTPPEREVRLATHDHLSLNIPPGEQDYHAETHSTFAVDSLILGLYPHAHFRGKSFSFEVTYPDGQRETLLSVPRFDFNWQTFYWLQEPKRIPAGAKLKCVAHYDNSRYNLNNPDPTANVHTGSQSTDEMMVGWVFFVAENPAEDADANELLVADRTSQVELLEGDLRQTVAGNSDDIAARLKLAHALYAQEKWDAAQAELEAILKLDPKFAPALHSLGRIAEKRGDDETAANYFRQALAIVPNQANWLNDYGLALVRLERYDEAIKGYTLGLKVAPDSAKLMSNLAFAYLKRGQAATAANHARNAIAIEPDLAAAHANLGLALAEQDQFDEAAQALRRSLELNPGSLDIQRALGKCLTSANRPQEAIEAYRAALELDPRDALSLSGRALALAQLGKLQEAMRDFRAALEQNDTLVDAHFFLGQCLVATGQPAAGAAEYRRALELNPHSAAIANNLAWLLATHPDDSLRDGAEAVRLAELAQQRSTQDDPGVLDTLAAAYAEAGRFDDAVRTMQRVIEIAGQRVDQATRAGMEQRLKLYQSQRPYRDG